MLVPDILISIKWNYVSTHKKSIWFTFKYLFFFSSTKLKMDKKLY